MEYYYPQSLYYCVRQQELGVAREKRGSQWVSKREMERYC